jgi:hypothetical protein
MKEISVKPEAASMLDAFVEYYNTEIADFDVSKITPDEAYIVWFNYTVGNAKALISTTRPDHKYYELTYHAATNQLHIDSYLKVIHESIAIKNM